MQDEATYVPHHKQKIVLLLAAMRHFADHLRQQGIQVDYIKLDDAGNSGSFSGELARALKRHRVDRVVATWPGEWRVLEMMRSWPQRFDIDLEIREDHRFLCSLDAFNQWAGTRPSLRMEYFYRYMRRKTGWLMQGDQPEGGRWNYDASNRKSLPRDFEPPARERFSPDTITREVISLVQARFDHHFGDLDSFPWAVTREQALKALAHFITDCLARFGDYQDAMKSDADLLFHALLSPYLNIGLLLPEEVCQAALHAYRKKQAPLAAVEGFVRQILGWREYVRGIYWNRMPEYADSNYLGATRALPEFYWTGNTDMNCLKQCITATRKNAYAHHIQRLMITGNFALLAGLAPAEVEAWYLMVYADAFEWVELPNTHGMVLYADGGLLASKPYAASAAYIHRMSDYCKGCVHDPKTKLGDGACPFNYLYWHFFIRNKKQLESNPRLAMPYRTLAGMTSQRRVQIKQQAEQFLSRLDVPRA